MGWPGLLRCYIVMQLSSFSITQSSHKAVISGNLLRHATPVPNAVCELLLLLSRDASSEVRSFASRASLEESAKRADTPPPENKRSKERLEQVGLFSRPPISSVREATPSWKMEEVTSTAGETDTQVLGFNGSQGNMDMDITYDSTVIPGQMGLSSNAVSGIYRRPPSASSYTYDLGVAGGTASEQVQVPV